ncbi:MAG: hypothetical protein B7Z55_10120 [Planctomycetales bacterium 12-60-4]|nr:MAG: hypothetical protein B7Z55_10120 [Planctomycetales bacterium 12-60-4]
MSNWPFWFRITAVGLMGCAATVTGCRKSNGLVLYPVTGKVRLEGHPLTAGSVSLRPEETGKWQHPTGVVNDDGTYVIYTERQPGAPPGSYRVVVFANEILRNDSGQASPGLPRSLISTSYHDPLTTPLRIDVVNQPAPGAYDLELKTHAK